MAEQLEVVEAEVEISGPGGEEAGVAELLEPGAVGVEVGADTGGVVDPRRPRGEYRGELPEA